MEDNAIVVQSTTPPPASIQSFIGNKDLTPAQQAQAREIAASINIDDPNAISLFAAPAQRALAQTTDPLLAQVRSKDTGESGVLLRQLLAETQKIDPSAMQQANNALAKLPVVGALFNKAKQVAMEFDKAGSQIEDLGHKLAGQSRILRQDVHVMERLYDDNEANYHNLRVYVAAGEIKLSEMRAQHRLMVREAQHSGDAFDAQEAADMAASITRLEQRIHDLKVSAVLAVQTAPQIRMIQGGNTALADKIDSSLTLTIPLWKQQFVIAMALYRQKNGLELQRAMTNATNDLILANAQALRQGSVAIATEVERGIVEMDTLKAAQQNLLETVREVIDIQEAGRQARAQADTEMKQLEVDLQSELLQLQAGNTMM